MTTEGRAPEELGRELFAAARREAPPAALEAETLSRMTALVRRAPSRSFGPLTVVVPVLLAAAAVALFLLARRGDEGSGAIVAERPVAISVPAVNPPPSTSPVVAVPPAPSAAAPRTPAAAASAPRASLSLAEEVRALDRARASLDGGKAAVALAELDAYQAQPSRRLAAEAMLLRIEALERAGKKTEASALAEKFVATYPTSPLVDRARSFVGDESP